MEKNKYFNKGCVFSYHDQDDDVEAVEEEVVDHLEVWRLGDHVAHTGLDIGHHQHAGDGHHDAVLTQIG